MSDEGSRNGSADGSASGSDRPDGRLRDVRAVGGRVVDGARETAAPVANAGDALATRVTAAVGSLPGGTATVGVALAVLTLLWLASPAGVAFPAFGFILLNQATRFVLLAMVLLGLNFQFGDTGIVNFGPVLFLALGLYGMGMATAGTPPYGLGLGLPWPVGVTVAVVAAVAVGGVLGLSSLRLREDYLAITTLAAAEFFHRLLGSFQYPFGGDKGIIGVPQLLAGMAENSETELLATFLLFAAVLLVVYEGFRRLSTAPYGRVLRAIQADEDAARSLGKKTFHYKMQAFVYGAAVAGFAGAMMALYNGSAAPGFVTIDVTVVLWIGMMVGGPGHHRTALAGLAIIEAFDLVVSLLNKPLTTGFDVVSPAKFNAARLLLVGLFLVLVVRYAPAGIWGDEEKLEVLG